MSAFLEAVGPRYANCTFDSFQVEYPAQNGVVEALQAYRKNGRDHVLGGQGIVLFGPPGTGKDHLLVALGRCAAGGGFRTWWCSGVEVYSALRDCISTGRAESSVLEAYVRPQILVLSDPLPPSGALTDFQSAGLLSIVDARYRQLKPTWVTLNVANGKEADERMGSQTMDRLKHGALCLFCKWPSYRRPMEQAQ